MLNPRMGRGLTGREFLSAVFEKRYLPDVFKKSGLACTEHGYEDIYPHIYAKSVPYHIKRLLDRFSPGLYAGHRVCRGRQLAVNLLILRRNLMEQDRK